MLWRCVLIDLTEHIEDREDSDHGHATDYDPRDPWAHGPVLRPPRPRDKSLAGTLEPAPAQKVSKRERRIALSFTRHRSQRRKDRLRLLEAQVDLSAESSVRAQRSPRVALGVLVA